MQEEKKKERSNSHTCAHFASGGGGREGKTRFSSSSFCRSTKDCSLQLRNKTATASREVSSLSCRFYYVFFPGERGGLSPRCLRSLPILHSPHSPPPSLLSLSFPGSLLLLLPTPFPSSSSSSLTHFMPLLLHPLSFITPPSSHCPLRLTTPSSFCEAHCLPRSGFPLSSSSLLLPPPPPSRHRPPPNREQQSVSRPVSPAVPTTTTTNYNYYVLLPPLHRKEEGRGSYFPAAQIPPRAEEEEFVCE